MGDAAFDQDSSPVSDATSITDITPVVFAAPGADAATIAGASGNTSAPPITDTAADNTEALNGLQRELLRLVATAATKADLLAGLYPWITASAQTLDIVYYERDEQGKLSHEIRFDHGAADGDPARFKEQLSSACQQACRSGASVSQRLASPSGIVVAAPIPLRGSDPEAIGFVFSEHESTPFTMVLGQMVASHIVLWHVLADNRKTESQASDSGALVELLDHVTPSKSLRHACYTLAGELEAFLQCKRVAIGFRSNEKGRCKLIAISGVSRFDKRSQTVQAFESAMDEAIMRDAVIRWPPSEDAQRLPAMAHKQLCTLEDMQATVSTPLHDRDGSSVGAIVVLSDAAESLTTAERFLNLAEPSLATSLTAAQRLEGGYATRLARTVAEFWKTWKGKAALAAVALVLASLMIPLPYKISCDCQIEPITRRYVAAPFEGTLEKSMVQPGDVVLSGALLARMDGREIRWKRAGVEADLKQSVKKRDVAQATHSYAEQQIAQLESERLKLELQLLDYRAENLEIKSPISGIVASGDLERAEGAPLSTGQTLFEIAPLEKMIVEVALPDDEISHIEVQQTIDVRLDAYPGQSWQVVVANVQPRSETREKDNVFIAEAELDNTDSRLRPGMKGRAKVRTPRRALGWILFHKPWEYLTKKLLW
jgi:biotin carboxyl carrier protein